MSRLVVVSVDGLTAAGQERIVAVAERNGAGVKFFPESDRWAAGLEGAEIAFGLPPASLVESSALRFLQLHSSGFEAYRTQTLLTRPTLKIANARGVSAQAVAEQCLAMMFALTRRIPFQVRNQARHVWQRAETYELLRGSTIAIVGMGAIGNALAAMCRGIGMRVLGVQRRPEKPESVDRVFAFADLRAALRESQHLAVTLPIIPLAGPLIGLEEFQAMPRGAYVYSMSRAALIDYPALVSALDSGQLAGAGLDVFPEEPLPVESLLWDREDVLIAPHSGGRFVGEMDALAALFADNLERYLTDKPLRNVVISSDMEKI